MKTLLILAPQPEFADAVRAALSSDRYRVVFHREVWDAEPLLQRGMIDACILDADWKETEGIRLVEELRRITSSCPIFLYSERSERSWEEEAYVQGVAYVLKKPIRGRLLDSLLKRIQSAQPGPQYVEPPANPSDTTLSQQPGFQGSVWMLKALRHFSTILTHSLCTDALLREFLLLLREVLGVNRAAIFLRQSSGTFQEGGSGPEGRRLASACALGLPPGLLEHFELSLEAGIGRHLYRSGRILVHGTEPATKDPQVQKELELLGMQIAIPVLDRESLIGVAVFDRPLTEAGYSNEELALMFHLLEQLGMAIRNSWLHDQVVVGHERLRGILYHISSGCVMVGPNLSILHANQAAHNQFGRKLGEKQVLEFSDLPQELGSRVFEAFKSGREVLQVDYRPRGDCPPIYQASITPFRKQGVDEIEAVLLVVEDISERERSRRLEVEAANLRLVRSMAAHIAHEVGNSMVPISAYQQADGQMESAGDQAALREEAVRSTGRISRRLRQMTLLARDTLSEEVPLAPRQLLEEAFEEARATQGKERVALRMEGGGDQPSVWVRGDRQALKQAFFEVFLNALEVTPDDGRVEVRIQRYVSAPGKGGVVSIQFRDQGPGWTQEAAAKGFEPFFTERKTGLGLGLTLSRKILALHSGTIDLGAPADGKQGVVEVRLPECREE